MQSIVQEARVQEGFVFIKARLAWKTDANQRLDFLSAPAVLTRIDLPTAALQLSENKTDGHPVYRLTASEAGRFEIQFQYQIAIRKEATASSFILPTPFGLVNRLELEIEKADVDVFSTNAVSVQSLRAKRQDVESTRADPVLAPVAKAAIGWKPRARDTKTEKAVFYVELYHLFLPTAGIIEGVHEAQVRPAQGQLAEVTFQIPPALTITDVQAEFVSSWLFDRTSGCCACSSARPRRGRLPCACGRSWQPARCRISKPTA